MNLSKRTTRMVCSLMLITLCLIPATVSADTVHFTFTTGSILTIGKSILSTVTINYQLIYGLGFFLDGLLILLIALVLPRKKTILAQVQGTPSLKRRRELQKKMYFPWKQLLLIVGLLFLLVAVILLSLAAIA